MAPRCPLYRAGIGDDPGRLIRNEHDLGFLEYRLTPAHGCEIVNIEVDNLCRRQGVGRDLINTLIRDLREQFDVDLIYAITRVDNFIAAGFYSGMRFRVIALLSRFYSGHDAVMYGRDLPRSES